jgi:hypothetical protein
MRIAVNFKVWSDDNKIGLLVCYPFKNDGEKHEAGNRMEYPSLFSKEERKRLDKFTDDLISIAGIQTQNSLPIYSPKNIETDVIDYLEDNGFTRSFIENYGDMTENIFVLDTEKEQNDFLNKIKEYTELNKRNKTNEMKHIKLFENFKQIKSDYKNVWGDDDPKQYIDLEDDDFETKRRKSSKRYEIDKKQREIWDKLSAERKILVDNTSELKAELEDGSFDKDEMLISIGYSIRTLNFESFKLLLDYFDFEPDGLYSVSRIVDVYILGASITTVKSSSFDVNESDLEKFIDYVGKKGYISEVSDEKYDRFLDYARHGSRAEKVKNLIDLIESYR